MPHRQNKGEDSVLEIYSTDPETLSPALISVTGVPPKAVIGPDPHLLLVEKSSVGDRPNMDVGEGGSWSQSFSYPSLLLTAFQMLTPYNSHNLDA